MASLTVAVPTVFICLVSIASLALVFAASEDHSADAGDCKVTLAAAATGASLLQSHKHASLERPLAVEARHTGVQKGPPIVNPLVKSVGSSDAAGQSGPEELPSLALPSMALLQAFSSGTGMQNFQAPHMQSPESISLAEKSSGSTLAAAATGASLLQSRKHSSLDRTQAVEDGDGRVQKGLLLYHLVQLVESSDAAGQNGPEALPSFALPSSTLLQAFSSGTGMQNVQAPHGHSPESISLAEQSSGSALSALSKRSLGLYESLYHLSLSTAMASMIPISLMLVLCSAILAMLHGFAGRQESEDAVLRSLPIANVEQGEGRKSAAQSTSHSLSYSSTTSLRPPEPPSPENPPNKAARSSDESAGSAAAISETIVEARRPDPPQQAEEVMVLD